jgi:CheY-like chemotaxis protein
MTAKPPVVAVFNTSPDVVDMLRIALSMEGFVVVTGMTFDIRDGRLDLEAFIRTHQPDVIVYDIAIPYEQNWRLCAHLRSLPIVADIPFVLTSTNAARVKPLTADEPVHEIVGKPYDLQALTEILRRACHRESGAADRRG